MPSPGNSSASKKSPATAAKEKAERVPCPISILCIYGNIVPNKHAQQIERCNKTMPQSTPKAKRMPMQARSNDFFIGTSRKQ